MRLSALCTKLYGLALVSSGRDERFQVNTKSRWNATAIVALLLVAAPGWSQTVHLSVEVSGVEGEVRSNVMNSLTIEDAARESPLDIEEIQRLHQQAPTGIHRALEPFGYYRARVLSELISLDGERIARYTIEQGAPILVERLDIQLSGEGREEARLNEVVSNFPLSEEPYADDAPAGRG